MAEIIEVRQRLKITPSLESISDQLKLNNAIKSYLITLAREVGIFFDEDDVILELLIIASLRDYVYLSLHIGEDEFRYRALDRLIKFKDQYT